MVDEEALQELRSSLEADGYRLDVRREGGGRVGVRVSATPAACADCLVPKPVLRGILQQALGVAAESIDLSYPSEVGGGGPHRGAVSR
jgi:hypothetical protein